MQSTTPSILWKNFRRLSLALCCFGREATSKDAADTAESVRVDDAELPSPDDNHDFRPPRARKTALPTPDTVRARALSLQKAQPDEYMRPDLTHFPELGLVVKWGSDITVAEGQCLWFIGKRLAGLVRVPEIYGWTLDAGQTFLYMELVHGDTLSTRWAGLSKREKIAICRQLRQMVLALRRMSRADISAGLSQIGGQPLRDIIFQDGGIYPAGPFPDIASFHDSFARLSLRENSTVCDPRREIEELDGLADDLHMVFTHADLDQSNMLISKLDDGPCRIVAIVDWHQSGWYPEPWEALKARMVAHLDSEWEHDYLPTIFAPPDPSYAWAFEYVSRCTI